MNIHKIENFVKTIKKLQHFRQKKKCFKDFGKLDKYFSIIKSVIDVVNLSPLDINKHIDQNDNSLKYIIDIVNNKWKEIRVYILKEYPVFRVDLLNIERCEFDYWTKSSTNINSVHFNIFDSLLPQETITMALDDDTKSIRSSQVEDVVFSFSVNTDSEIRKLTDLVNELKLENKILRKKLHKLLNQ